MSPTIPPTGPGPDEDDVLARVRDADPAREVEPDVVALRAAVDARIAAEQAAGAEDELAARRRRRRWPVIAAAAAGVLVVGTAGYGVGRLGGAVPADGVITLAEGSGQGGAAESAAGGGVSSADARLGIYPQGSWRTVFSASGLSDATTRAMAWTFDAAAVFSAETAESAARALGLEGTASSSYGAWMVGSQDGTGPSLTLQPDGWASVSYYDPTRDPYSCLAEADAGGVAGPVCATADPGPAPSGADAAAQLRALLAALGIDDTVEVETTAYDVPEQGAPRMTSATAFQVIDGARTGVSWTATLLGSGPQSFYGPLAPLVELGEYDVVSENTAVARLNDPRFGATGGVMPLAAAETARAGGLGTAGDLGTAGGGTEASDDPASTSVAPAPSDTPTVPPTVAPGTDIPWPVTQVTITGARLGSAVQWLPDGQVVLLPAYDLTDDDDGTWSVVAVADDGLDFAAE